MKQDKPKRVLTSTVSYETLEGFVREKAQGFIQEILEEEVSLFLGREKSERFSGKEERAKGYRNGHGNPRKLSLMNGTITLQRPRVRDTNERFESKVLPLFKRKSKEMGEFLPELYLHGLSKGDFELALRNLLGDGAPLSPSSIQRLKGKWQLEYEQWKKRDLTALEVVYIWADGIYVKSRAGER